MRNAEIKRKTSETDIALTLELDGTGIAELDTGCGFLNHMLELFARHGGMNLTVSCKGDREVDDHHTAEDIGIALGRAVSGALGERRGIFRYGSSLLPMDEALVQVALDISGRGGYYGELPLPSEKIGSFDTELIAEFFLAFAREADITLHIRKIAGQNSHHIAEAAFKGFGRALAAAAAKDANNPGAVPSTKGTIL